ncbi:Hypothetical_protein [Hexamita inflata]|uniref:Hypothetical_protein n=1 Tax=Hexamita inflata TaxID=28002 RepID=A0AA86TXX9_9EUKA|nr:Hypothetical protein HINF_LOCUS21405 [Hexamita inflata]
MNVFDKEPSIQQPEFCLSTNYIPESEEKQMHLLKCLQIQNQSYITRNIFALIQTIIKNFKIIKPRFLKGIFELINGHSVKIMETDQYQLMLQIAMLSDDYSLQEFGNKLAQQIENKNLRTQACINIVNDQTNKSAVQTGLSFNQLIQQILKSTGDYQSYMQQMYQQLNAKNLIVLETWAQLDKRIELVYKCFTYSGKQ